MIQAFRRRYREDKGAALLWVAGTLTVLLTTSAFAVDLGWVYLNNSRLQAAADAAALAGVVNLPGFPSLATADATDAAASNGFPIAGTTTLADAILDDNQYQVFLETDINTFFLKVIGIDSFRLAQDATAEYIKPVRLGSPDNQFGGPTVNFWAAINGRYTEIQQGDPYASQCQTENDIAASPGCKGAINPLYRAGGYYYAVEVGSGSSNLSVQFYDGGHYMRGDCGSGSCSGTSNPGDTSWAWGWPSGQRGVQMQYRLYAPDTTPNDPFDNTTQLCSNTFPTIADTTPSSPSSQINDGHLNQWTGNRNCSVAGALTPGIYVLQLPSPLYEGSTKFGIRATVGSGPAPKVYGLLDMSIHVNFDNDEAEPYLAEVRPEHAGKVLEVDIWDLGDTNGSLNDSWIEFRDPVGGSGDPPACSWTSSNGLTSGGTISNCNIKIGNQRFNADWLYVELPIPDTYTCDELSATGCWWKILIHSEDQPTDRTTWSARISGDPVRLVD
jgi:hypothetical protein